MDGVDDTSLPEIYRELASQQRRVTVLLESARVSLVMIGQMLEEVQAALHRMSNLLVGLSGRQFAPDDPPAGGDGGPPRAA